MAGAPRIPFAARKLIGVIVVTTVLAGCGNDAEEATPISEQNCRELAVLWRQLRKGLDPKADFKTIRDAKKANKIGDRVQELGDCRSELETFE